MSIVHTPERPVKELLKALKTKKAAAIVGALPSLLALRSALPTFIKKSLNRYISHQPGFAGSVEDVRVDLWSGKLIIKGVVLRTDPDAPGFKKLPWDALLTVPQMTLTFSWHELMAGALVANVTLEKLCIYASVERVEESTQPHPLRREKDKTWQSQVREWVPFKIERLVIRDGEAHVRDLPGQDAQEVAIRKLYLLAQNLTNNETLAPTLKATLDAEAEVMNSGWAQVHAKGFPLSEVPTFDADFQLRSVDLRHLDFIFKNTTATEVKSGTLDFYAEAAAAKGAFKGYIKPVIDNMHVRPTDQSALSRMKALAFRLTSKLLKNKQADRIATRMAFEGAFAEPNVGYISAAKNFLRNAFVEAFKPRLERSIFFSRDGLTPQHTEIDVKRSKPSKWAPAFSLVKDSFARWNDDNVPRLSAALSYYTVFSLAPLLIMTIGIAGIVFGQKAAEGQIVEQVGGLIGQQGAEAIQGMIQAAKRPAAGIFATAAGVVTLLIGASGVMSELKDSLNKIWRVTVPVGIGAAIKGKILSYTMVLVIGFLLLTSLVISALMAAAGKYVGTLLPIPEFMLQGLNTVVSFLVITVLFALLYKILPDTYIAWKDVWVGSAVNSFLFSLGKLGIGLYLGKASVGSSYGAAGSVLVVLVWVYYSSMILYLGAEFTKLYADRFGSAKPRIRGPLGIKVTPVTNRLPPRGTVAPSKA